MKLLFFDTECANCNDGNGKICSFGYVLADENFNIIEKSNILINPLAKFILPRGMTLGYKVKDFLQSPTFDKRYNIIADLFLGDVIVLGPAIYNDARYLISEFERYNLKHLDFEFYDTQLLYMSHYGTKNQTGLEKIMSEIGEKNCNFHKSDEDALMSILCFAHICKAQNKTVNDILLENQTCKGVLINGKLKLPPIIDVMPKPSKVIQALYHLGNMQVSLSDSDEVPKILGKKFAFDLQYLHNNPNQAIYILNSIIAAGGIFEKRLSKADFLITQNDGNYKAFKGEVLKVSEILSILDLSLSETLDFEIKPFLKKIKRLSIVN